MVAYDLLPAYDLYSFPCIHLLDSLGIADPDYRQPAKLDEGQKILRSD
jgi:hypothetical protein